MDKILLIVSDWNLRQLYHELLLSKNIEVMPVHNIENALLILTSYKFKLIVIYVDEKNSKEVLVFLNLRKKRPPWLKIKLVLITEEPQSYQDSLTDQDKTLNLDRLTPTQIADQIKTSLVAK